MKRSRMLFIPLAAATVACGGAVALATPPTGQTTEVLATGSTGRLHVRHDGIRITSRGNIDAAVATVTFAPGSRRAGTTTRASSWSS